jgi:hypothetical protein
MNDYALVNIVIQCMEIVEHIFEKRIQGHNTCNLYHHHNLLLLFCSHTQTFFFSFAIFVKECITFKNGMLTFNSNYVSTIVSKYKLNWAMINMGAFNVIFMKRVQYSNKTHFMKTNKNIHLVLMLCKFLLPLISIIFITLMNSKCLLRLWLK